jgi:hypothetical protein
MLKAKRDRETETTPPATSQRPPAGLDELLGELDELLELLANKALLYSESPDDLVGPVVAMLTARLLADQWREAPAALMPEERAARVENAWRRAMIEAQERAQRVLTGSGEEGRSAEVGLAAIAEEIATYREHLPKLVCEHPGRFVLIKGTDILGTFSERSVALQEGYRRFGAVPFLVRQIADPEPVVYLPNVVP